MVVIGAYVPCRVSGAGSDDLASGRGGPGTMRAGLVSRPPGRIAMLRDPLATHEVTNQPPPLTDYDVFGADRALRESVEREGAGWALDELHELGRLAGSAAAQAWGEQANDNPPVLRYPRPVRQPRRPGRVPPRLPRPDAGGGRPRAARGAVGRRPRRGPTWPAPPKMITGTRSTAATSARSR